MSITKLISELEKLLKQHGDLPVHCHGSRADYGPCHGPVAALCMQPDNGVSRICINPEPQ